MRTPMPRHSGGTLSLSLRDVDARLDREHHARLERARLAAEVVVADVVHVHAEPVAGLVHEERLVRLVLHELLDLALEEPELHEAAS